MDFNQVKELLKIIDSSSFVDFNIDFENTRINLSKNAAPKTESIATQAVSSIAAAVNVTEVIDEPKTIIPEIKPPKIEGNVIEAPLVGTFYKSAAPDKPPFVQVGSKVKKGDVLCIIEAMKVMNEIKSSYDGTVAEILVENEDMVEYGQRLFVIA